MLHTALPEEPGDRLQEALERGKIVLFPRCPIELPTPADLDFLRDELPARLERKNVSYYPDADRLVGVSGEVRARTQELLRAHARRVTEFLGSRVPGLTRNWRVGTSSFRPLQEKGRGLSAHASNELVHVDAGAYGATHGDRVLRFFVNVNPAKDRVWISRGAFGELFERHGAAAGVRGLGPYREGARGALSVAVRAGMKVFPMLRVLDTSDYDRRMRRFHNWMKDTPGFQDGEKLELRFPPLSAWMVFTDGVSHACIEGQHAFVDTFVVPLENCALRERTPFAVLQQ